MPAVGMRRSTRVFVPKSVGKDGDVVLALRSSVKPLQQRKHNRGNSDSGDEWFELLDDRDGSGNVNGWRRNGETGRELGRDVEVSVSDAKETEVSVINKFGAVYNRKRRRSAEKELDFGKDPMYGIQYVRKKRRTCKVEDPSTETVAEEGFFAEMIAGCQDFAGNFVPKIVSESPEMGMECQDFTGNSLPKVVGESAEMGMECRDFAGNSVSKVVREPAEMDMECQNFVSNAVGDSAEIGMECQDFVENPVSNVVGDCADMGLGCEDLLENSVSSMVDFLGEESLKLYVTIDFSPSAACYFTCFFVSILKFMSWSEINLSQLSAFLCSEPIVGIFFRHGIHFSIDSFRQSSFEEGTLSSGFCQFFGTQDFVPLFTVDFCAIPLLFVSLQSSLFRRSLHLPDVLLRLLKEMRFKANEGTQNDTCVSENPTDVAFSESKGMDSGSLSINKRKADSVTGVTVDSVFSRYGLKCINVRRKRSSLKTKKARNPSAMNFPGIQDSSTNNHNKFTRNGCKVNLSVNSNLLGIGNAGHIAFSGPGYPNRQARVARKSPSKEANSNVVGSRPNMDQLSCSASVLLIGSDACYRVEGTKVLLESLPSKVWHLVIKIQGVTKYTHKAQEAMNPNTITYNLFTHACMWTAEDDWKLEFPERKDFLTFKELHKECVNRNAQVQSAKTIPVPGVHEVTDYVDGECVPFLRPDSYITINSDEVARAFLKRTSNYDMDVADEEWLKKFNSSLQGGIDAVSEAVSMDKFEELIDVFERAAYHSSGAVPDEGKAFCLCSSIGKRETVAAVYHYWLKKRRQKRAPLIKVFQCPPPPPKKAQVLQEKVFRKKRSFKKQPSLAQKGNDQISMEALPEEQEQDAIKAAEVVKEAQSRANEASEVAILKRRRAEKLMENAELATYRAMMAMRIAEVALVAEPPGESDSLVIN